ncbi:MAG: hypothetical protein ACJ72Z_01225 [Pyrinomonadaceae bacterium]
MRLHSDFHDYYDNAVGYGIDERVYYARFTKSVDIKLKSQTDRPLHRRSGILGFCGIFFPFIQLSRFDKKRIYDWEDEYDGKIVEEFFAFSFAEYKEKENEWCGYSDDIGYFGTQDEIKLKQFFLDWQSEGSEIFLEFKCPVWMMRFYEQSPNGVLNPRLKDLGFERIKDSVMAFQEISIYLANILVEQKEIAVVEDKHRIEQHGFDLKSSFRKTKEKKKEAKT